MSDHRSNPGSWNAWITLEREASARILTGALVSILQRVSCARTALTRSPRPRDQQRRAIREIQGQLSALCRTFAIVRSWRRSRLSGVLTVIIEPSSNAMISR